MRFTGLLMLVISIWGCTITSPSPEAAAIRDADLMRISTCGLLGKVKGEAWGGGLITISTREEAKFDARQRAADLGATHIRWETLGGEDVYYVTGHAYRCR